ncbi:MAG TPA: phosphatase PAP2 family protein [Mucilaginibacter sp.]|nr:phosphatase PAP2 family protein [Mucilaginibacter sp.]
MGNNVSRGITVTPRSVIIVSLLSAGYLLLTWWLVGLRSDHFFLVALCNLLFYASPVTRRFLVTFFGFAIYWMIFDYMKAFPNYRYNPVHIADLYNFEKHFFGIEYHNQVLTANEYFRTTGSVFLDVMTGLFYLCWIPVPLGFAFYLFFSKRPKQAILFLHAFVIVNILGFIGYYTYPAAPPWYVQQYGFNFHPLTGEGIAGLARFDDYFHAHIFSSIYSRGSNVFAAMPSLHSAYPVIVLYYSLKNRLGWINIIFATVVAGIWFAAVYTSHHYIADVIAGILCASAGIGLLELLMTRSRGFKNYIEKYTSLVR